MTTQKLDVFTAAYIEAMLWSTPDSRDENGDISLDLSFSITDFNWKSLAAIIEDCRVFQVSAEWQLALDAYNEAFAKGVPDYGIDAQGGHDFWVTRNGYSCGFWDGEWTEPHASGLTALAKSFDAQDVYVGDDGQLYVSGNEPTADEAAA